MSELIEKLPEILIMAAAFVGGLAFAVSVIIEVIKNISFIKNIPTDLLVIVLSVALTVTALFIVPTFYAVAVTWYMVVGAILGGLFVAFVAMYGWDKLSALWTRFKK